MGRKQSPNPSRTNDPSATRAPPSSAAHLKTESDIARYWEACKLYKAYRDEFQRDPRGSQWMSDKSLNELSDAFSHCKPLQPPRGFEAELTRLRRGTDFEPLKT